MNANDIAVMLAASRVKEDKILIGIEEARLVRKLSLPPWKPEEVVSILDEMACQAGGLGISARFAKARFLLRK